LLLLLSGFGLAMILIGLNNTYAKAFLLTTIASTTAILLRCAGFQAHSEGAVVALSSFRAIVVLECTGVFPAVVYGAAIVTHPARWTRKCLGIIGGVTALFLLNELRLVSLLIIGAKHPASVETIHLAIWQPLIILFTLLLWLVWAVKYATPEESS